MHPTAMTLLMLPVELLGLVLDELCLQDLLVCKRVCSCFFQIIKNNLRFQYRLELAVAGMVDGAASRLSTAEKLGMLQRLEANWRAPRFTSKFSLQCSGSIVSASSNTVVELTAVGDLHVARIPSAPREIDERHWVIKAEDVQFPVSGIYINTAQDLLLVLEDLEQHGMSHLGRLHIFPIAHAAQTVTSHVVLETGSDPDDDVITYSSCLWTDFVAWQVLYGHSRAPNSRLRVWNWKTGKLLWNVYTLCPEPHVASYAFLGDRYIILSVVSDGQASLRVYEIDNGSIVTGNLTFLEAFECSLELPRIAPPYVVSDLWIRSYDGLASTPSSHHRVPFHTSPQDVLFAVTFNLKLRDRDFGIAYFNLFIPASVIFSCLKRSQQAKDRRVYRWRDWGPTNTRLLFADQGVKGLCNYISGWKALVECPSFPSFPSDLRFEVYDFNPLRVRLEVQEHVERLRPSMLETTTLMCSPTVFDNVFFEEPIKTSLPYHITKILVPRAQKTPDEEEDDAEEETEAFLLEDGVAVMDHFEAHSEYRFFSF